MELKQLRIEKGYTQQQMSDLLDIGLTTYHQYETSERDVPYVVARQIAKLFDVEVDEIFLPTRFTVSKYNNSKAKK